MTYRRVVTAAKAAKTQSLQPRKVERPVLGAATDANRASAPRVFGSDRFRKASISCVSMRAWNVGHPRRRGSRGYRTDAVQNRSPNGTCDPWKRVRIAERV